MRFALAAVIACQVYAQTVAFEAAVIKPSLPLEQQKIAHMGVAINNSRVDMGYQSLTEIVALAYGVSSFQIMGPDWMKSERFDIDARLPSGANQSQVPQMLQAMLAERFRMTMHRENRPTPVYNLIVGKGGPKLELSDDSVAVRQPKRVSSGMTEFELRTTMANLASFLSRMTPRPVFDKTGLTGKYRVVIALPLAPSGEAGAHEDESSSLFSSVEALGLKLDPQKEPLETITVDHLEKMPSEN